MLGATALHVTTDNKTILVALVSQKKKKKNCGLFAVAQQCSCSAIRVHKDDAGSGRGLAIFKATPRAASPLSDSACLLSVVVVVVTK